MRQQAAERTEKATPRQRQRVRNHGQFPYSQEVTSAITLAACAATVFYCWQSPSGFRAFFAGLLQDAITNNGEELVRRAGSYFLVVAAPIFGVAIIAALAGNLAQGLPIFASEASFLKWEKLNPMQGLSHIKAQLSWIQWLKLFFLVGLLSFVIWKTLSGVWDELSTLPAYSIAQSNLVIRSLVLRVVMCAVGATGIVAIADFYIQRWRFEQSIRQTRAEVKDDTKASQGNPAVRNKIRSIQRDSRRRMMSRLKDADLIVTSPMHQAVALEYKPEQMPTPRVVAKGRDLLIQKLETGQEHDIPTVENLPLATALYRRVEIEEEIPAELYRPVAQVLADIYRKRKRT